MSMRGDRQQRQELAQQLARLRALAGISGRELGQRIDVDQSTISRIERADQRVSLPQVIAWAKATEAPAEEQARLLALAERILTGPQSWEEATGTDSTNLQKDTQELEDRTGLLSIYLPAAIPGLLQTAAYATRLFSSGPDGVLPDLAQRVLDRMERQRVLYDESKRFRFVIPEAVLRWPYGPPDDPAVLDEQREQLARVDWATGRPNIEVGILPLAPVAVWRLGGFVLYDEVEGDDPTVHLEWLTRPFDISDPGPVEMSRRAFANLLGASVTGTAARDLISQALDSLAGER